MKKVKITVMRAVRHDDLIADYENPMEHPCDMRVGQVFIANGWNRPEGLCLSAWESMSPFVMTLAHGGTNIYNGWMKNPRSAMISCNDGFRPVSFLLEALNEEAT
ncbi:MAG: TIGR04076 family protein [Bacteroidaceae bacterium]|nr:TIGR04076 family protein [Bacteroidaceae bacterium]